MDNLESQTYEIFERDPIKYRQYQRVRCHVFNLQIPNVNIHTLITGFYTVISALVWRIQRYITIMHFPFGLVISSQFSRPYMPCIYEDIDKKVNAHHVRSKTFYGARWSSTSLEEN